MEGGVTKAFEIFGGYGVVGAVAVLALVAAVMLYREVRDVHRKWMEDRQAISDKRIEELRIQTAIIERNTAAHLEATKTNEARAITLQRLVDDHAKHEREIEGMQTLLKEIRAELQRRGVL